MANKTFSIDSFPSGSFMSWFVTTQAAFTVHAKLYDSKTTYFEGSRTSTNISPPLNQGFSDILGSNVKISIDVPQSNDLKSSINTYNITNDSGAIVGYGYNICIEDSGDADYNDISISLIAWKSKG